MNLIKSSLVVVLFLTSSLLPQQSAQDEDIKLAAALTESVVNLAREEKYDVALPLAKKALAIRERLLPAGDPLIAQSLSFLADIYTAKRDFASAKTTLQRLLQLQQDAAGPNDGSMGRTLDRLATVYLYDRDLGKAEETFKRALPINEKSFGAESLAVSQTILGLATVYRARNDFKNGAPLYKRALLINARLGAINGPAFDQASQGFVCLAHQSGNREATKELDEIWKQYAGAGSSPESPYTDLNARALRLPKPEYSAEARARRAAGVVVMKIRIDQAGRVISAQDMCQGSPFLVPGSLESARNASFKPAIVEGKPVVVDGVLSYRYVSQ